MNIIDQQECLAYDDRGYKRASKLQLINTGIVVNNQPVIEWNYVSEPGITFAQRGNTMQSLYPKQPKCPEEFWRRTPRIKVKINEDIYFHKLEMRDIKKEIAYIDSLVVEKAAEFGDACCMVNGLASNQKSYMAVMDSPCSKTALRQVEWGKKKLSLQKDYETLQRTRSHLQMLYSRLHRECLQIRNNERK